MTPHASIAPMLSVRRGAEEPFKIEGGGVAVVAQLVDPFGHHWEIGKPLGPGVGE